jgi:hypothetical protein
MWRHIPVGELRFVDLARIAHDPPSSRTGFGCSRTHPSRRDIRFLRRVESLLAEMWAQKPRRIQIYLPPQNPRKLFLHPEECQPRRKTRLEFHQHIHVAVRPEIFPQHGAKQAQPPDVVPPAKRLNSLFGNRYLRSAHSRLPGATPSSDSQSGSYEVDRYPSTGAKRSETGAVAMALVFTPMSGPSSPAFGSAA